MARDLLTFVANFYPGIGGLDRFSSFVAESPGKVPQDLPTLHATAILKISECCYTQLDMNYGTPSKMVMAF